MMGEVQALEFGEFHMGVVSHGPSLLRIEHGVDLAVTFHEVYTLCHKEVVIYISPAVPFSKSGDGHQGMAVNEV